MKLFATMSALCVIAPSTLAQCVPSATNHCITHNGIAFVVNGTARLALTLTAGTTYTFQLNAVPTLHPFYLTNSAAGGFGQGTGSIANVTPNTPQAGNAVVTFSPTLAQVGTNVFYNCNVHSNMGARITIVAPLCPADFNEDGTVDFFDYLDFVDSFSSQQPASDFNQDGVIDFFDYLDFVDAFAAPC